MKPYIATAIAAAAAITSAIAIADTLPVNSGRPAIKVPTGFEVKGATDYEIDRGEVKQIKGQAKINKDMLDGTLTPAGE